MLCLPPRGGKLTIEVSNAVRVDDFHSDGVFFAGKDVALWTLLISIHLRLN